MSEPSKRPSPGHDAFVKFSLNDMNTARGFFELFLDVSIAKTIDLSALRPGKTDSADKALTEIRSDLLFHVPIKGRQGGLSLLIEHKSQGAVDQRRPTLPFQLRRNEIRIMEEMWRNNKDRLYPTIYSLGLYHGNQPYNGPMSVAESMMDAGPLTQPHWQHKMTLSDLSLVDDQSLTGTGRLELFLLVLKHVYDRDFNQTLDRLKKQIQEVDNDGKGVDFMEAMFRYIISASRIEDKNEIKEFAVTVLSETSGERVMTIAEQLIEEGRQEGSERAYRTIVMHMFHTGLSPEDISNTTGLPLSLILRLTHPPDTST